MRRILCTASINADGTNEMTFALIGFSGFVGSSLIKQACFESLYRSTNIRDIEGQSIDTVVCAGAPAQKWIANWEPEADHQKIDALSRYLSTSQDFTLDLYCSLLEKFSGKPFFLSFDCAPTRLGRSRIVTPYWAEKLTIFMIFRKI